MSLLPDSSSFGELLASWVQRSVLPSSWFDFHDESAFESVFGIFATDYARYYGDAPISLEGLLLRPELQGILMYRLARYYFLRESSLADGASLLGRQLSGFEMYYSSDIGPYLKINHGLGTVIGARVKIGSHALIHQGVTFGDRNGQRPVCGNHNIFYAGSKVLGGITLGNHVTVGANSVCLKSVPDHGIVVGVPGRIILNPNVT
jgi:serine O-acetyltransferase